MLAVFMWGNVFPNTEHGRLDNQYRGGKQSKEYEVEEDMDKWHTQATINK